ncbi:lipoate--protein ligase family protein [Cyanobium sp. NS01]|uniref:lipoate--protein ligase family protein n=1 Tax=Cyanobium sp. NS01 TaxID=261284 RepID=UPI0018629381|nr:lipoate--protein ligase family protein [Cyanobium sp. NS01]QNI70809.1 lipoate---protein ligase [Cyanobium sp. NS01]
MQSTAPAFSSPGRDGPEGGRPGRWLPGSSLGGDWQMAIDAWLLAQERPAFRLYRWLRPTLSLGRHQRRWPEHWQELAAAGRIELVRRPSGGRAVLHGGDLSYALIWPTPPPSKVQAYAEASTWLRRAFAQLGQPLLRGNDRCSLASANCFELATAADLVHADGSKRIGSAQLWRGGRLLQHGSIQLAPPAGLWQELFGRPAPCLRPLACAGAELEAVLHTAARQHLPFPLAELSPEPLRAKELAAVAELLGLGEVSGAGVG